MLQIAVQAVRIAGEILRMSSLDEAEVKSKDNNPRDIVSVIDCQIEDEVRAFLRTNTPHIDVMGEEYSSTLSSGQGQVWVLDPIDGTSNFVQGLGHYAVSLALLRDGKPVLGVVYDPNWNRLFTAVQGQGAFLNGFPLWITHKTSLAQSFICIEWGRTPASIASGVAILRRVAPLVREVR